MPEIKQYTRQILPQQTVASRRASGADFGGDQTGMFAMAEGYGALANSMDKLNKTVIEIKERRDKSEYLRKYTEFQLENQRRKQELSTQEYDDGVDFASTWAADLEERAKVFAETVPSTQRERWDVDFANMKLDFVNSGMTEQIRRAGIKAELNYNNTLDNIKNGVATGAYTREQADYLVKEAASAIPNIAPEDRALMVDEAMDSVLATQANKMMSDNPFGFKTAIKNGEFNDLPNLQQFITKNDAEIERRVNKANKEAAETELIRQFSTGESYVDPSSTEHKKIIDKYYQQLQIGDVDINSGLKASDPIAQSMALEFGKKYKIVPESMQSTLRSMMNGGDASQKAFAYNLVGELESVNAVGFSSEEKRDATTYTSMIDVGYTDSEAINSVTAYRKQEFQQTREFREKQFQKMTSGVSPDFSASSVLKSYYGKGWTNLAPEIVSVQAMESFSNTVREEYLKSGDMEAAKKAALAIHTRQFGQSEITGSETIMQYPPERYGNPELTEKENLKWMKKQMKSDLESLGYSGDTSNYDMQPIYENKDLVRIGEQPRYFLLDKSKNDFVKNADNTPLVYYFDLSDSKDEVQKRKQQENAKIVGGVLRERIVRSVETDPNSTMLDKAMIQIWSAKNKAKGAIDDMVGGF